MARPVVPGNSAGSLLSRWKLGELAPSELLGELRLGSNNMQLPNPSGIDVVSVVGGWF